MSCGGRGKGRVKDDTLFSSSGNRVNGDASSKVRNKEKTEIRGKKDVLGVVEHSRGDVQWTDVQ